MSSLHQALGLELPPPPLLDGAPPRQQGRRLDPIRLEIATMLACNNNRTMKTWAMGPPRTSANPNLEWHPRPR